MVWRFAKNDNDPKDDIVNVKLKSVAKNNQYPYKNKYILINQLEMYQSLVFKGTKDFAKSKNNFTLYQKIIESIDDQPQIFICFLLD